MAPQVMAEIIASSDVEEQVRLRMDSNITTLENALGVCERIFKNPVRTPVDVYVGERAVATTALGCVIAS